MKISIIIPYRADFGPRDNLWSQNYKRYRSLLPRLELIVGIDQSRYFCKARAVNNAAKLAQGDVFFIADSDVVFDIDLIDRVEQASASHPWIVPFTYGRRLTLDATRRLVEQGLPAKLPVSQEDFIEAINYPGVLLNVVSKEAFWDVKGYDERFIGWGGEDEAFAAALDTICGLHYRLEGDIYHLWHPPAVPEPELYSNNFNRYQLYRSAYQNLDQMRSLIDER